MDNKVYLDDIMDEAAAADWREKTSYPISIIIRTEEEAKAILAERAKKRERIMKEMNNQNNRQ